MDISQSTARIRVFSFIGTSITVLSCTISKNGGGFGAISGTGLAVIDGNYYKVTLDATDTDTLGDLCYRFTDSILGDIAPNGETTDRVVVAPGAAGGAFIAGSNAATTIAGLTTGALECTTLTATGAVDLQSTLTVTGATTLTGAVSLGSTLGVTGTTTLASLAVTTTTTLTGNVSLGGTLGVAGTTTLAALNTGAIGTGAVTVTGALGVTGTMTINAFVCSTNFTVTGNWLTTGTTTWTGAAAFSGGLTSDLTGDITGTLDTVTDLTNAPTVGDFTAAMKASLDASTPTLASDGLDAVVVEVGLNARQALAIVAASCGGVLSGAATTTITIKAAGVPATTRVVGTVDSDGNRSAVTLSPPA